MAKLVLSEIKQQELLELCEDNEPMRMAIGRFLRYLPTLRIKSE